MKMKRICWLSLLMIAFAFLDRVSGAQVPVVRMQQVVQSYADAGLFMGSVLVAENGRVLLSKGYGWADVEWNIPNSPTTRFLLASMTKQFTAASILLLEDRGKLSTDDLVKKYIPDAPAAWDKITIYNLLTHTSGISDAQPQVIPNPPDKTVLHIRDMPLDFQPGEQWAYSSVVYALLGYLVEKVSGQNYGVFVQENIFKPLGMNDSGFDTNVAIISHRASGYRLGANGVENAERTNLVLAFSAGALYSTTEDLLRWEEGLFGGRLLSVASLRKITTPFRNNYGCGSDFLASKMHYPELNIRQCAILAAYVLHEAKEHVDGCGGDSQIAVLRNDGTCGIIGWHRIGEITELVSLADETAGDLLMALADIEQDDQKTAEVVNFNLDLMSRLRDSYREKTKRQETPEFHASIDMLGLPLPKKETT